MRLGIVADDLTGAADSVASFAERGIKCAALLDGHSATLTDGYDAVSISTETRDLCASSNLQISRAVVRAMHTLNSIGIPDLLCKKVDSTLRGHNGVELEALRSLAPGRIPIVCPAFPAQNRIVVNRKLIVGTEEREYVLESFESGMSELSTHVDLRGVRHGPSWFSRHLAKQKRCRIVYFDAESDADLRTVAAAIVLEPARWLPVGSAGFMSAIASQIRLTADASDRLDTAVEQSASRAVLYIVGSCTAKSRRQTKSLERAASIKSTSTVRDALAQIGAGSRVAIATTGIEEQDRGAVLENLLEGSDALFQPDSPVVVATGGATAAALLSRFESFSHLDVLGELEPGIAFTVPAFSTELSPVLNVPALILKSGGFGNDYALARCAGIELN